MTDQYGDANEFDYYARVDILGWVFEMGQDGALRICTSEFPVPYQDKASAMMALNPAHVALLAALLALPESEKITDPYPGMRRVANVGYVKGQA
jgi:hypothetical protein